MIDVSKLQARDYLRRPLRVMLFWIVPIAALVVVNVLPLPHAIKAGVAIAAFAWIGVACLANALKCGRVHCWFTGPWCLLISLALFTHAALGLDFGGVAFGDIANIGGVVAIGLWFLTEPIFGRYFTR